MDLWSAGVILYTMLVGRPPYESKDVKSTYRRILANVYAFPESVPVSESAKDLVRRLLQVRRGGNVPCWFFWALLCLLLLQP